MASWILTSVVALIAVVFGIVQFSNNASENSSTVVGSGRMFDVIAPRYDITNTILSLGMHKGWRERMISALELQPGESVLDAGTGTADVAIMLAEHLKVINAKQDLAPDSVVGIDPSDGMLAIGRGKVAKAGFDASVVRLVLGDAQDLGPSLPDSARFDAATMAFAIRNVPDRGRALAQLAQRLRPGGRLAVLELQPPSFAPARWFVRYCVPALGALMSGGAWREYQHLERSVLAFNGAELVRLIEAAGLEVRRQELMNFGSVGLYVAVKPRPA